MVAPQMRENPEESRSWEVEKEKAQKKEVESETKAWEKEKEKGKDR